MRLAPLVARIAAQCPGFAHVGHGLTSDAAYDYPAAFVLPVKREATLPAIVGVHSQLVRATFGVQVVLERRQDAPGHTGGADLLDDLTAELRAALVGWFPGPPANQPLAYAGGVLDLRGEIACWREDFATEFELRI